MSSSDEAVAKSLLDEVEQAVEQELGSQIALPYMLDDYDADRDFFCKKMVAQCDLAEKKAPDSTDLLIISSLLKAQLYGCWRKIASQRGTHNKAVKCYDRALQLGGNEAEIRYRLALLHRVHAGRKEAIENFERVIELVGPDSELGLESAKELEKEKAKKGCFVATAACGDANNADVLELCDFRDNVLDRFWPGRRFISLYYFTSPTVAQIVARNSVLRWLARTLLVAPVAGMYRKCSKSSLPSESMRRNDS